MHSNEHNFLKATIAAIDEEELGSKIDFVVPLGCGNLKCKIEKFFAIRLRSLRPIASNTNKGEAMIRLSHAVCKRYFKLIQRTHFCYESNLLKDLEYTHSHFDFHIFSFSDVCASIKR